jgi:S-layer family protein
MSSLAPVIAEHIDNEVGNILKDLGVLKGDKETGDLMLDDNFKRQDMVVMISRLYKEEKKAKDYVGTNIFKDLNKNRKFYIPYITWAKDEGLIEGMEKDKFGFNGYVTVQQFQTVLLRSLGYGEEAKDWALVPEYAKSLGIMKDLDLNPSDKLSRGKMAHMVLNTLNETTKTGLLTLGDILNLDIPEVFKVDSEISVDQNTVIFKGITKGTDSLKLNLRPTTSTITGGAKLHSIDLDKPGRSTGKTDYRPKSGTDTGRSQSCCFSYRLSCRRRCCL